MIERDEKRKKKQFLLDNIELTRVLDFCCIFKKELIVEEVVEVKVVPTVKSKSTVGNKPDKSGSILVTQPAKTKGVYRVKVMLCELMFVTLLRNEM